MKACVFFLFKLCPWIIQVGDWALRWTEGNEMVQVFFVMLFFPVIMNALQYYIIDGFIKDQKPSDHEPIPSEDGEAEEEINQHRAQRRRSRDRQREGEGDMSGSFDSDDDAVIAKQADSTKRQEQESKPPSSDKATKLNVDSKKLDEYNPNTDGEESPTVVGSGSNSNGEEERSLLPQKIKQQSKKK